MHRTYREDLQGNACDHFNTIHDDREGTYICTDCGLVLEESYCREVPFNAIIENDCDKLDDAYKFLQNVCEMGHLGKCFIEYAITLTKKLKFQIKECKYKEVDLAVYALYETLHRFDSPRTPQEICYLSGMDISTLWKIEKEMNHPHIIASDPTMFVERYCSYLDLSFWDKKIITEIARNMYGMGNKPNCLVAVATYLYCKQNNLSTSLKSICEVCGVSTSNVHKIVRNMNEKYIKDIYLLCTDRKMYDLDDVFKEIKID